MLLKGALLAMLMDAQPRINSEARSEINKV